MFDVKPVKFHTRATCLCTVPDDSFAFLSSVYSRLCMGDSIIISSHLDSG